MSVNYPLIDHEAITIQNTLLRAMLKLHAGGTEEVRIWFWGREYLISVMHGSIIIKPTRPGFPYAD